MSSSSLNVNTIVRAGAGAGKTRRLIETVKNFCTEFQSTHSRSPRLIICTFTRKAAKELRERLMELALKSGDWEFVRFVTSAQLHVSTIHGVLVKFLSHFGYRLGLDPRFRFIDTPQATHQAKNIMREIFNSDELTTTERALILKSFGFKDLANLGIKFFEFSGWQPNARVHDEESLRNLLQQEIDRWNESFDVCVLDVKPFIHEKQVVADVANWLARGQEILRTTEFNSFTNHLQEFPRFQISEKNPKPYDESLARVRELHRELKKDWTSPAYDASSYEELSRSLEAVGKCLSIFRTRFLNHKLTSGEMQISDLEVISLELIRQFPDTAKLFSVDWDYWMVDEYQDTSPIQVELIKQLQGGSPSFTVGDPQQSIYLFRGARCEVFAAKEKELKEAGGHLDHLDKNYRSRPQLVRFFNKIFASQSDQFFTANPANESSDLNFADVRIVLSEEKSAVVSEVKRLLHSGVSAENIAILARQRKSLRGAAKSLADAGIPCLLHAAGAFYERREVLDALALLRFLLNPHDNSNFISFIRSPWFHISDEKIVSQFANQKTFSFWTEAQNQKDFARLKLLLEKRDAMPITELFREALVEFGFFDFSHYLDLSGRREANLWKLVNDLEQAARQPGFNFVEFSRQKMRSVDLDFSDDEDAVSAREANRVNLMTVHQSKGLQFDHVVVIDIDKASKKPGGVVGPSLDEESGRLSFPVFWSPSVSNEKTLGDIKVQRVMKKREAEESARVFYVAVTRAVQSLVLIGGPNPEKESWLEHLKIDLSPGEHQADDFRYAVLEIPEEFILAERKTDLNRKRVLPVALKPSESAARASVTQLVKSVSGEKSPGNSASLLDLVQISERGILMHKLFEAVKYQGLDFGLENASRFFPEDVPGVKKALNWVYQLQTPKVSDLIENGQVEWGFQLRDNDQVIEGQIDLWGRSNKKVWIIDYKTGSSRYIEKAFAQMKWYGKALRASGVREEISLAVIFPFEERVEIRDL